MMKMNVEKVQKQVSLLLTSKGLVVDGEPLAEFILADRYAHEALFPPESLPDGDLWFGAGSLIEMEDDTEIFSIVDDSDKIIALAKVTEDEAEVWMNETGEWKQVEEW